MCLSYATQPDLYGTVVEDSHVAELLSFRRCILPQLLERSIVLLQAGKEFIYLHVAAARLRHEVLHLDVTEFHSKPRLPRQDENFPCYIHTVEVVSGIRLRVTLRLRL